MLYLPRTASSECTDNLRTFDLLAAPGTGQLSGKLRVLQFSLKVHFEFSLTVFQNDFETYLVTFQANNNMIGHMSWAGLLPNARENRAAAAMRRSILVWGTSYMITTLVRVWHPRKKKPEHAKENVLGHTHKVKTHSYSRSLVKVMQIVLGEKIFSGNFCII